MTQSAQVPSTEAPLACGISKPVSHSSGDTGDLPARAISERPLCKECGVPVEQIHPKGPSRTKHAACRCVRRALNELGRRLDEIPMEATTEAQRALGSLRAEIFALANRIPTGQPRDRRGRFAAR